MTITITKETITDWPSTIPALCELLQQHLQEIPEEYRSKHWINIEADDCDAAIAISFERPMTQEELDQQKRIKSQSEAAFLATLAVQAARYGKKLVDA